MIAAGLSCTPRMASPAHCTGRSPNQRVRTISRAAIELYAGTMRYICELREVPIHKILKRQHSVYPTTLQKIAISGRKRHLCRRHGRNLTQKAAPPTAQLPRASPTR